MDKILISNSFKSLLQSLGAKTSNSNYAVPVVTAGSGTTAGTPQGYMDMASLASVLGGIALKGNIDLSANTDLNDVTKLGTYCCPTQAVASTLINAPYNGGGFVLLVFSAYGNAQNFGTQIVLSHTGFWFRTRNVSGWSTWTKLA